ERARRDRGGSDGHAPGARHVPDRHQRRGVHARHALDPAPPRRGPRRAHRGHLERGGAGRDGPALARAAHEAHPRRPLERRVSIPVRPGDLARLGAGRGRPCHLRRRVGLELYVPTEFAGGVYDAVVEAGEDLGLRHAGYHAMDSLRMEKAYRSWGHDLGCEDTPLEAGLGFAVRLDKRAPFTGREALLTQREKPLTPRLLVFVLDDPEPLLYHDEPVWRDGALVGRIASGAYGPTLRRSVGLGWGAH